MKLADLQLKNRKRITYCSPFVPAEWIAAHGFIPHFFRPRGSEQTGPIENSAGICAFMRAFVNEAVALKDTDAIVITTSCDQMRRAADIAAGESDKPVFLFHVPVTWQTPGANRYYLEELERLGRFLKRQGGMEPQEGDLISTMKSYAEGRKAILSSPSQSSGGRLTVALNTFYDSGEVMVGEPVNVGGIPVAIVGGPLTQADCGFLDLVEQKGGSIVLDGSDNGERTLPARFNMRRMAKEPLEVLAEAYFGSIPDIFRRPNNEFFSWIKQEVEKRHVRGVFLMRYVWCDLWHAEVNRIREWLDVPTIDIDLNSEDALSRNNTRIEAFLESLK